MYKLTQARLNTDVTFVYVDGGRGAVQRLTDMGLIPGERIRVLHNAGRGPLTVQVKGAKIALGHGIAEKIIITEDKKIQKKGITIALAGNPNSGKSSIFNNLTGIRQHTGNYPGVTVEKKEGSISYRHYNINIIDLPGTYSLSAYSEDEVVARNVILNQRPDLIVGVVDASNLERNLYLVTQLMELDIPIVLAMNMSDVAEAKGQNIDYKLLSELLGTAIVPTVGNKNKGTSELIETIIKAYEGKIAYKRVHVGYGREITEEMNKLGQILTKDAQLMSKYSLHWLAIKMLENDRYILDVVKVSSVGEEALRQNEKSRHHLQLHFGDKPEIVVADRRYGFISGACTQSLMASVHQRHSLSDSIDKVLLNKVVGLPIFALVMFVIFKFTFGLSGPAVRLFEGFFSRLAGFAEAAIPAGVLQSFIVDGVIGGVGGVLGFFPLVLFMFFAVAFFEDTGYMARASFVMDKIMSKFGLGGKSFLPLMISTNGCAVPGMMASRTLDNKRDRLITMMVTPFMICGAKLPVFVLFIGAFFPARLGPDIMLAMYFLSIVIALGSAWALKKFVFKGEHSHLVLELPPYRLPSLKGLFLKTWERGWMYLRKAGTIILFASMVVWFCFSFPSDKIEESYAGRLGRAIEPVMRPIGLDWRGGVALISGFAAKEMVVSTYGTLYSISEEAGLKEAMQKDPSWNPIRGLAFLIFSMIYLPCLATIAVFFRESGSVAKWTLFLIFWTTAMAWFAAFLVYQVGRLL